MTGSVSAQPRRRPSSTRMASSARWRMSPSLAAASTRMASGGGRRRLGGCGQLAHADQRRAEDDEAQEGPRDPPRGRVPRRGAGHAAARDRAAHRAAAGQYQIGELHARSCTVFGKRGSQQPSKPSVTVSGLAQSTPAATHWRVAQRQVGTSSTRA
jgi:hypothetical protein